MIKLFSQIGPTQASFSSFNIVFNTVDGKLNLPMIGFELRIYVVGSDHSINFATTTARICNFYLFHLKILNITANFIKCYKHLQVTLDQNVCSKIAPTNKRSTLGWKPWPSGYGSSLVFQRSNPGNVQWKDIFHIYLL